MPKIIAGIGTVSPLRTVIVRPRTSGMIMSIEFEEGQTVKAGDPLASVDPRELNAALRGAQAKRDQDEAQLDAARTDLDRYDTLSKKGVVAPEALDQKVSLVKQFEGAVSADDAALAAARDQAANTSVTAPIAGQTGFKSVDVGALVSAGSTDIVTVTQLDPIGVVFVAPGDRFGEIRDALKAGIADVEAWSTDGSRLIARGKLTLMDNQVDTTNGSIRLRATFDNHDNALWPGLPVATRLTVAIRTGPTAPDKALSRAASGLFAYVVGPDNHAKKTPVSAAFVTEGVAAIDSGLAVGDRVVTDGASRLGDGDLVVPSDVAPTTSGEPVRPAP